ncbi:class D sortase [Oceanicoccus sagamiensis]|uniref:Class D sortase n=1 Tax=Oceanicoccus sagamiensis TaxID=716816 RepID=A0A1X9NC30_9GAMM|nr:class D sortase [Oceanicoccus sagamiensis]ARN75156.1 hypothetical protein BST96_14150 [Oceanicoccus sagamiensis]
MTRYWNLKVLAVTEAFSWLLGITLLLIFFGQTGCSEIQRQQDIDSFESSAAGSQPSFKDWAPSRVDAYHASLKQQASEVLAVLSIPNIKLDVPIYNGASDLNMDRGVARIAGTALPDEAGNFGIAGHRDGYFRALKDVKAGDYIHLKTYSGISRYRIDQTFITEPDNVDVLRDTDDTSITLVTCYPFYFVGHAPQRYIVKASLDGELVN